jgi:hypothetical protein
LTHLVKSSQSQSYIATDGLSISKSWCRAPSGAHDQIFIIVLQLRSCFCGAPSLTRGRVCWSSPVQSFSDPSPLDLAIIFYCLTFETSLFVASYDSQGHGGGILPNLHTGYCWSSLYSPGTDRIENVSSIIAGSHIAGETTCPQSCSLATTVLLSPVYTAVTWQWF